MCLFLQGIKYSIGIVARRRSQPEYQRWKKRWVWLWKARSWGELRATDAQHAGVDARIISKRSEAEFAACCNLVQGIALDFQTGCR